MFVVIWKIPYIQQYHNECESRTEHINNEGVPF